VYDEILFFVMHLMDGVGSSELGLLFERVVATRLVASFAVSAGRAIKDVFPNSSVARTTRRSVCGELLPLTSRVAAACDWRCRRLGTE
jgi:hypothetical protein